MATENEDCPVGETTFPMEISRDPLEETKSSEKTTTTNASMDAAAAAVASTSTSITETPETTPPSKTKNLQVAMTCPMIKCLKSCWHPDVNLQHWESIYQQMLEQCQSYSMKCQLEIMNNIMMNFQRWYVKIYRARTLKGVSWENFEAWLQEDESFTMSMRDPQMWTPSCDETFYLAWMDAKRGLRCSLLPHTKNISTLSTTVSTPPATADATKSTKSPIGVLTVEPPQTPTKKRKKRTMATHGQAKKAAFSKIINSDQSDDECAERTSTRKPKRAIEDAIYTDDEEDDATLVATAAAASAKKKNLISDHLQQQQHPQPQRQQQLHQEKRRDQSFERLEDMLDDLINQSTSTNSTLKISSSIYTEKGGSYVTLKSEELSGDIQVKLSINRVSSMKQYSARDSWKGAHYRSTVLCSSKDASVRKALEDLQIALLKAMKKDKELNIQVGKPRY